MSLGYTFDVLCLCDGHDGVQTGLFVRENLLETLRPLMPQDGPESPGDVHLKQFAAGVQRAVAETMQALDDAVCSEQTHSGCTCTVAIVAGPLLTIANVGALHVSQSQTSRNHFSRLSCLAFDVWRCESCCVGPTIRMLLFKQC